MDQNRGLDLDVSIRAELFVNDENDENVRQLNHVLTDAHVLTGEHERCSLVTFLWAILVPKRRTFTTSSTAGFRRSRDEKTSRMFACMYARTHARTHACKCQLKSLAADYVKHQYVCSVLSLQVTYSADGRHYCTIRPPPHFLRCICQHRQIKYKPVNTTRAVFLRVSRHREVPHNAANSCLTGQYEYASTCIFTSILCA